MHVIYICGLEEMPRHVANVRPSHLVSIVGPDELPSTPPEVESDCHLRLGCHDIVEPLPGYILPELEHVQELITFARGWNREGPLLVHCLAGVSRSTAAALIVCAVHGEGREAETGQLLRAVAPHAHPNRRMVSLADHLLGREGKLTAAVEGMGPSDLMYLPTLVKFSIDLNVTA